MRTLLALCPVVLVAQGWAQQAIFNVPNGDILQKGQIYVELDMSLRPNKPQLSSFVPRIVFATDGKIEVGLNVNGNVQPGPDHTTLSPTVKWKVCENKERGWALLLGDDLYFPVRNRTYDVGNYVYSAITKTWPSKTRVAAGAYHFTPGVVAPTGNRAGGQFSIEQTVHPKTVLAADWYTGRHSLGYFTPGLILYPTAKLTLYTAYSIGNDLAPGNHFFLVEIAYTFARH
jgi:hypothetical protein